MIKVHHLNNSRSHRVIWLLEELGLPYEIVHYKRDPATRLAPAELKKIHPLGKSPVITDGNKTIAESGTIIEYLCKVPGGGKLWPKDGSAHWLEHSHWMHYAEGSAMLPFLLALYTMMLGANAAPLQPRIDGEIANNLGYMEGALGDKPYFCGSDLTAADVQLSFVLEVAEVSQRLASFPKLKALLERMRQRPAYKAALDKGGPLELIRR